MTSFVGSDADAIKDRVWFRDHPHRRYRVHQLDDDTVYIVRRRGSSLLRTRAPAEDLPDDDQALRRYWVEAAWPDMNPPERKRVLQIIKRLEPVR